MQKLFSTNEVHPRDRFDYWHAIACQRIVRHDSRPKSRQAFHASMQGTSLVDSQLLQFDNSGMDVWRTRQHAEDATSADVFFCLQLMGSLVLEQSDRTAILEAGDMALLDPALPYAGRFSTESHLLVLKTPRCALEARVGSSRDAVVRQLKSSSGEPRLLASYFASLPSHIDRVLLRRGESGGRPLA